MWPNDATTRVSSVEMLDTTPYAGASKHLTCPEMLGQLPGLEVAARRERRLATRTKLARLSCRRTLRQFNPGFQPSIDERQVRELACRAFLAEAGNPLLLGPPGVGQTRLAWPGPSGPSKRLRGLLLAGRPDGGPAQSPGRAQPGPADADLSGLQAAGGGRIRHPALRPGLYTTTALFTLSWARYPCPELAEGNGAAASSLPTRVSASGVSSWAPAPSPRPSWTGCRTTATCSTSGARATG